MTVTFLVAINVSDDASQLPGLAEDIHDDLSNSGFDVESVKPWARPNDPQGQPAGGFSPLPSQTGF